MRYLYRSLGPVLLVLLASGAVLAQSISSVAPTGGPVGTSVTITGSGFGATQGSSTITFNGVAGSPTAWSDSSITVPVPSGATTGNIIVTVGGSASNGYVFAVATSNFTLTGSMNTARMFHTSTLLDNGQVLVAGGVDGFDYNTISTAELYNPANGTFTYTGSLNAGRIYDTASLVNNGNFFPRTLVFAIETTSLRQPLGDSYSLFAVPHLLRPSEMSHG